MKTSKVGKIWEIRKKVLGGRKANIVSRAIVNPENGKMAVTQKEVKNVTLKYCIETLANNPSHKDYELDMRKKEEFVVKFMKESGGEFETSKDTFDFLINKFRKKGKRNYHFITKASNKFQDVVYKLCQRFFSEEKFPEAFKTRRGRPR